MLAREELSSGAVTDVIRREFGISQPAVSSISGSCATRASRQRALRERGGCTPSRPRHCERPTGGSISSGTTGRHTSMRSRRRWPAGSASVGHTPASRRETRDRRHRTDPQRQPTGRQPCRRRRTGTDGHREPNVRHRPRGPVGRLHERRAHTALVSADHGRPARLRALSTRGQRGRSDRGVRAAPSVPRHVGVRGGSDEDRGSSHCRDGGTDAA